MNKYFFVFIKKLENSKVMQNQNSIMYIMYTIDTTLLLCLDNLKLTKQNKVKHNGMR